MSKDFESKVELPKESKAVVKPPVKPRAIRFDNKHYHDSAPFSTPPSPAYSAVTYYNSAGFLNG